MKHETLQIIKVAIAEFITEREKKIILDPSLAERFYAWRDRTLSAIMRYGYRVDS